MRTVFVIEVLKGVGDGVGRVEVARPVDAQAFIFEGAMLALDEGIFVGAARRTDRDRDPSTQPKPDKRRRKGPWLLGADEPWIAVKGDLTREAHLVHHRRHGGECGFHREIRAHHGI